MTQTLEIDRARPRSRRTVLAAVLLGGLLIAGCGSGDGTDAGSTATAEGFEDSADDDTTPTTTTADSGSEEASGDACDIVSDDVSAEVLGVEVVRREPHGEPGSGSVSCIKGLERTDDPASFSYVSVAVVAGAAALVDEASAEEGSQPVAGLGNRAVYVPSAGALFIADGADGVQVQVVKAGIRGSQQDCVTVANDVLGK